MWNDPTNWSAGVLPGLQDDVIINVANPATIHISGDVSIKSLADNNAVVIDSGSLTTTGPVQITGSLSLESGTVSSSEVDINSGTLNFDNGVISAPVMINYSTLNIGPNATNPENFTILGGSTLTGNVAAGQRLWVQGGGNGSATLMWTSGFINAGTIHLESINSSAYSSSLVMGNESLINSPTGLIELARGSAGQWGSLNLQGSVVNQGTIHVLTGAWFNLGGYVGGGSPTMAQQGGSIVADGTMLFNTGSFDFAGGSISGNFEVANTQISVESSVGTASTIDAIAGNTLAYNNSPVVTIWVQGNGWARDASLTTLAGGVNAGTIQLKTIDTGNVNSNLVIPSGLQFTNSTTGIIEVDAGSGGGRSILGSIINEGSLHVAAGSWLNLGGAVSGGSPTLTQQAGAISVDGTMLFNVGSFYFQGGTISGNFYVANTQIDVAATAGSSSMLHLIGTNTLVENAAPGVTLWVEGIGWASSANLIPLPNAVNAGTILLEPIDSWALSSNLSIPSGSALTNTATGVISAIQGSGGGHVITGDLINQGSLNAASNTALQFYGTYEEAAGTVNGPVYFFNSTIRETTSPVTPTTIILRGTSTLATDNLANVTLWVEGISWGGNARLTVAGDATNEGTILLESGESWIWSSDLAIASGAALSNMASGIIEVESGSGGERSIAGEVVNFGSINVGAGTRLDLKGVDANTPPTLLQADGAINATGQVVLHGGTFDFLGGVVTGAFYVNNSSLDVASTVTTASTVFVTGASSLVDNASPAVTLAVQGDALGGSATLTAIDGATNAGTLLLASADSWIYDSNLAVASGAALVNLPTGVIEVDAGSGGQRTAKGELINFGTITVSANTRLDVKGLDANTPPELLQVDGTIHAAGQFVLDGGRFDFLGGTLTGAFNVNSAQVEVAATVSAASTVIVTGASSLIDNASPFVTLWVQGDQPSGSATFTAQAGATNAGIIGLESADSANYDSNLAVVAGSALVNLPTGLIVANAGTGGNRSILGNVTNFGVIGANANTRLDMRGRDANTPPRLEQVGGSIDGVGQFVLDGGRIDFLGGVLHGYDYALNAQIYVAPSVTSPSTLIVSGGQSQLVSNESPEVTLWVQGNQMGLGATLTALSGAVNAGDLVLASVDAWHFWSDLAVATGATLTNLPTGMIQVYQNLGEDHALAGSIANYGAMYTYGSMTLPIGTLTNHGIIAIQPATQVDLVGAGPNPATLIQADGSVVAPSLAVLTFHSGSFNFTGGSIFGDFEVRDSQITVANTVWAPSVVKAIGLGNTLVTNDSPNVILEVLGCAQAGSANLTTADQGSNYGKILLNSDDWSQWSATLDVGKGTFTNQAGATIAGALPPSPLVNPAISAWNISGAGDLINQDLTPATDSNGNPLDGLDQDVADGIFNLPGKMADNPPPPPDALVGVLDNFGSLVMSSAAPAVNVAMGAFNAIVGTVTEMGNILVDAAQGYAVIILNGFHDIAANFGMNTPVYYPVFQSSLLNQAKQADQQGHFGTFILQTVANFASLGVVPTVQSAGAALDAYEQHGDINKLAYWAGGFAVNAVMVGQALEGAAALVEGASDLAGSLQSVKNFMSAEESGFGAAFVNDAGGLANSVGEFGAVENGAITKVVGDLTNAGVQIEAAGVVESVDGAVNSPLERATALENEINSSLESTVLAKEVSVSADPTSPGRYSLELIGKGCFAAGTPLLTPTGFKPIEVFRVGDMILSRSEFDSNGPLEAKEIQEVFSRLSMVLEIKVSGRTIGTTSEHPFWVHGKGWQPAYMLQSGQQLLGHTGELVSIESIKETDQAVQVHNLRIADHHTYFVGDHDWGFCVWAHNACWELGDSPSAQLEHNLYVQEVRPGAQEKVFETPWSDGLGYGSRKFDDFDPITKTAFEGNTTPWNDITLEQLSRKLDQAAADFAILKDYPDVVKRIVWFGTEPLPTTGLGNQLRTALQDMGIQYYVVQP